MQRGSHIKEDLMTQKQSEGRDELNLAEFPLCALSRRLPSGRKTIRFEDCVADKTRNQMITRQLTITGSDAYGLPTPLDDEVLLGLIQLTRLYDFADRKVPFTRHLLLRVLGWSDDSKNYRRLEESLNRWTGVTLYYQKAWWNKAKQCWMDEKFHILDNVWLCHRGEPAPDTGFDDAGAPLSAFVWNEVIFRSFQAGNLKSIDFDFFKSLESAIAKRLYRFLDKRFYHRPRWEFDLKELAWEHIGLSRSYDTGNLKNKLMPGIRELELHRYLEQIPEEARFRKLRAGKWLVGFQKAQQNPPEPSGNDSRYLEATLVEDLTKRGVSVAVSTDLVAHYNAAHIQAKLKTFDSSISQPNACILRNPPGLLVSLIKGKPTCARASQHYRKGTQDRSLNMKKAAETSTSKQPNSIQDQSRRIAIDGFWQGMPRDERTELEAKAIESASKFEQQVIARGGSFAEPTRKAILDAFALKTLRP